LQDDFLGFATLSGDAGAGAYELELQGGAYASMGNSKADGVLKVRTNPTGEDVASRGAWVWVRAL
jgi:hypothetical protein